MNPGRQLVVSWRARVNICQHMLESQTDPLRLMKVLTLWDLIFYGLVLIQPTAPIPLFGVAQKLSNGHTVTTILVAMLAMVVTAFSYGRMAAIYPSAGSAYTYVGRAINPHLGFMVGWAMLLDYILQPLAQCNMDLRSPSKPLHSCDSVSSYCIDRRHLYNRSEFEWN